MNAPFLWGSTPVGITMPSANTRGVCGVRAVGVSNTTTLSRPRVVQATGSLSLGYSVAVMDHMRPASSKETVMGFGRPVSSLATSSMVKSGGRVKRSR